MDSLDDGEFFYFFKLYWVGGRWYGGSAEDGLTTYQLFKDTVGSFKSFISDMYTLSDEIPFPVIEASYLTFLSRVKAVDSQNVSMAYMRLLKSANMKVAPKITRAVLQYGLQSDLRSDLRLLGLEFNLR